MVPVLKRISIFLLMLVSVLGSSAYASVHIVAAENFYGEVAKQLGGPYVEVVSILHNPNQDPHLFTTSVSTAVAITKADMVSYNGADYDPWMKPLLAVTQKQNKHIIVVAELMHIKKGSNPHIWYMPETMLVYAREVVHHLSQLDPSHQAYFQQQFNTFNQSYQPLFGQIKQLKMRFGRTPVIATEPVFNYMADAIHLDMHGKDFQINIMNDIPPSYSQTKKFEEDLQQHTVKMLIFNNQVINPSTEKMLVIAKKENIPVLGVSETMPAHVTYVEWMMKQLKQLDYSLGK